MEEFQKQLNEVAKQVRQATIPFDALAEISKGFAEKFPKPDDFISKELRSVMGKMSTMILEQTQLQEAIRAAVIPKALTTININPILESLTKLVVVDQMNDLVSSGRAKAVETYMPENWRNANLSPAEVLKVAREGWVVSSVPSSSTLQELVAAMDHVHRRSVHADEMTSIVAFTRKHLAANEKSVSPFEFDLLMQSLAYIEKGEPHAAQALSTVVFDTRMEAFKRNLLVDDIRFARNIRDMLDALIGHHSTGSSVVSELHGFVAFVISSRAAWEPYNLDVGISGEPYNRHATIHRPNKEQYNLVNALVAAMLATAAVLSYSRLGSQGPIRINRS